MGREIYNTIFVGRLDYKTTEETLKRTFDKVFGDVVSVHIVRDTKTGKSRGYGFVEFKAEEDADYSIKILHMIKLFNKPIKVNKASQDKRTQEVGAKIFVGNLSH